MLSKGLRKISKETALSLRQKAFPWFGQRLYQSILYRFKTANFKQYQTATNLILCTFVCCFKAVFSSIPINVKEEMK
nr:hypothetical protein CFP56_74237 [Quercus suber]